MLCREQLELLDRIKNRTVYENKFFETRFEIKWFDELKKRGYFNPTPDTAPQPTEPEGHYHIPQWNVLPYLEKISQQVIEPGNEKYSDELAEIIHKVTDYHIKNGKVLDNYRTWRYFVKILCNLPNEKIDDEILDLIPIWLDSKFDNSLPGAEILKRLIPKFLDSDNPADLKRVEKVIDNAIQIKWIPKYTQKYKNEIKEKYKSIFEKPENERTDEENLQIAFFDLDEREPITVIDSYWLLDSFIRMKNAMKIGEKCSDRVIFIIADRLKDILEKEYPEGGADNSYIWIDSIFNLPGDIHGTEETLTVILRDIILAKAKEDKKATTRIFAKFLSGEYSYPIFKRILFYIIGCEWNTYKDIFWKMLKADEKGELFDNSHFEPEIYTILEKNVNQFSLNEKKQIVDVIIQGPKQYNPDETKDKYIAYWKQKWYSAMKLDSYFAPLYAEQQKLTQIKEEIGFKEPTTRVGPGPFSLSMEEILRMQKNEDLANYLKEFKTTDFRHGPTVGGLADQLKLAAQTNPEKFLEDMCPFKQTAYYYVYHILWGFREAWQKKQIIDWGNLFNFIKQYMESPDFWEDKYEIEDDQWHASYLWVIGVIGELIIQGTKDDTWVFSEEYIEIAQRILFTILDRILTKKDEIYEEYPPTGDYVTYALNSTFGKIAEALFTLTLRIKRIEEKTKKEQEVSWIKSIRDKYDEILQNQIIEGYVWLGRYLLNFYYLDKAWIESKIATISTKNSELWEGFMEGYLFSGRIYNELYKLMKQHYLTALDYEFKDKHSIEGLVQHICIGYLRGIEDIDSKDSLFRSILNKWSLVHMKDVIGYFWLQRDWLVRTIQNDVEIAETEEITKYKNHIIAFWRWVYNNKYKDKVDISAEDKEILSELSKLTIFLPRIDTESSEWLKLTALYVDFGFNAAFFIEYLDDLKDKDEKAGTYTGEIFLEILKNSTPDFDEKHIRSIVEYLYNTCRKNIAKEICSTYGSRGFEFLRDIYDKDHKNCKGN